MICTNCNAVNDPESVFCVNCGNAVTGGSVSSMPTVAFQGTQQPSPPSRYPLADSTETAVVNLGGPHYSVPQFAPSAPFSGEIKTRKTNPIVWVAGGLVAVLGLLAVGIFFFGPRIGSSEVLPDHLGMFVQSAAKDRNDEISKQDFSKVIEAKNAFMKNDNLTALEPLPNLILYADGKDIPINDLRLIQLDTIKDDGNMKQLDFQVAPVEGKPEMKRIRMPAPIANGKYAFALLDSYFNDGKHKFWAFQVRNSPKSENGDSLKDSSVALKPAPPPQQSAPRMPATPTSVSVAPPSPGNSAVSITNGLILRAGPGQSYAKIRNLGRGERVDILGYSSNTESFKGRSSPFAQVRTANGQVGWAFSAYLR